MISVCKQRGAAAIWNRGTPCFVVIVELARHTAWLTCMAQRITHSRKNFTGACIGRHCGPVPHESTRRSGPRLQLIARATDIESLSARLDGQQNDDDDGSEMYTALNYHPPANTTALATDIYLSRSMAYECAMIHLAFTSIDGLTAVPHHRSSRAAGALAKREWFNSKARLSADPDFSMTGIPLATSPIECWPAAGAVAYACTHDPDTPFGPRPSPFISRLSHHMHADLQTSISLW